MSDWPWRGADRLTDEPVTLVNVPVVTRDDGLTDAEGVVADHIVAAVEAYARLPRQHAREMDEFVDAIHRIQDLLAMRIARRLYPKGWPTHGE